MTGWQDSMSWYRVGTEYGVFAHGGLVDAHYMYIYMYIHLLQLFVRWASLHVFIAMTCCIP